MARASSKAGTLTSDSNMRTTGHRMLSTNDHPLKRTLAIAV